MWFLFFRGVSVKKGAFCLDFPISPTVLLARASGALVVTMQWDGGVEKVLRPAVKFWQFLNSSG